MARCLNLTKAGEYAVAALARLALEQSDPVDPRPISIRTLAQRQRLPEDFLSKIIAQGVKAGLLKSRKGPLGGVVLARPANRITLLEIIEAFEGNYRREFCVFYPSRVCDGPSCQIYCLLREKEEGVRRSLGAATLAGMAASLRRHPENIMEELDGNST